MHTSRCRRRIWNPDPENPVKIYDVFPYNSEADILEIRLRELSPVVSRFVIVECLFDEHGRSKEPTFYIPSVRQRRHFAADHITYAPCTHEDVK